MAGFSLYFSMMKHLITTFCLLISAHFCLAQHLAPADSTAIQEQEQLLKKIGKVMFFSEIFEERRDANYTFIQQFKKALKVPGSYHYNFPELNFLKITSSPDNQFRIISWQIELPGKILRHFGTIQMNENELTIYPLIDRSEDMDSPDKFVGDNTKWYGALYYDIIERSVNGNKKYFLLGIDTNHPLSNKKLIDVLQFNSENKPIFGAPLFQSWKRPTETVTRFLLEYKGDASVSLSYDQQRNSIVYDHLVPLTEADEGIYLNYIPDGTFNELVWSNNQFRIREDVIATTLEEETESTEQKSDELYQPN